MRRLMLILPLIALAGCASNVALKDDSNDATQAVGTLTLTWLQPQFHGGDAGWQALRGRMG
jgi:hypothetical protein